MSIQVRNLTHIYSKGMPDEQLALDNISFDIGDGQVVGVIGHTGSGKSTLLQHLNGLLKADSGSIKIGDTDITQPGIRMKEIRQKVGLVFQYPEYQLFEETVALDVAFGPKNLGLSAEEIEIRVKEALELVGLDYEDIKERSPFELSGGQKRRVAIAGVIAMKPQVLILDEPTAGLDPGAHKDILKMIKEVHRVQKNIIIFVSHNMADVADLSDKVMVMDDGKLVTMGTPEEVFSQRERLEDIGLDVPPVTDLMYQLKAKGIDINTDILNLNDAEEEIYNYLQRKKMIRDITLGQYYGGESLIHRLDPRVKIIGTILFIAELFIADDFIGFAICTAALAAVVAASKVPLGFIMRGLKPILLIIIFTFCLNIFMTDGRVLLQLGFLKVTAEGLYTAAFMAMRLILLIIGSSLLTLTTKPISLTDGIERLLRPMSHVGVPTHEIAMMMSIALRFIPTLLEETDKIMKAQQARGADFESGNILNRAKALVPILVPLFVSAFRIAQDLAMAMEARCYRGGKGRTRMHQMKFQGVDFTAITAMTVFLAIVILERIFL